MTSELRKKHRKLLRKGNAAGDRGDHDAAERHFLEYIAFAPDDAQALFNLGVIQSHRIKKEKDFRKIHDLSVAAMDYYSRAILSPEIDIETKANALNNTGLLLLQLGFPEKAKISFHLALQLCPEQRAARLNYADTLVHEGQYEEADREFFEIINSDPASAGALFCRSMIMLLMGDIRRGFMEYRARYNVGSFISKMMDTDKPLWNGEDLSGKTLAIHQEQGYGDAIMFIRYAELVKQRWPTSRVIYHGYECLGLLLRGAKGVDECFNSEPKEPVKIPLDYHIPLMHMPDVFATTLETIPGNCPYILPREDWMPLPLPVTDKMAKIGIVWAGSPAHGKDKFRSMTPEQFQRFIDAAPNAQFYSLQCGPRQPEFAKLKNCIDLAPFISDWTQTANAILQLDLVITVDTAVSHLAGALGKPVWILLASSPDFRWMLTRTTSPWYPTARLFRQEAKADWSPVIQQVIEALK